ncbi:MAG: PepSY domain-containing protein [Burkholderiaceae bacterium]|nr:MAG: PepSY domain-containing protein [Burkholderiaceae bacterium]
MKLTAYPMVAALLITLGTAALPALAADDCDVPIERWQPREAVLQMAASRGWNVERLKIDDGCYELRGTDAEGHRFKAKIDPETLATVKMKVRERSRDRDRKHRDESRNATPLHQPPGVASSGATDHSTSGASPHKQVD